MEKQSRILLLTGKPGVGKTTLICKIAERAQHYRIKGFYTREIREHGRRQGFRLLTFDHEQAVIAHVNFDQRYRVGKYGVDVARIDHYADIALNVVDDIDLYLIDEIGKMECLSERFVDSIQRLLHTGKPLIATVALKGGGLIDTIKHWPQSEVWEVTLANRNQLPDKAMQWLQPVMIEAHNIEPSS
jgi:nucleoside-triphosphatase